jgi:peptidylprolyl isomerase
LRRRLVALSVVPLLLGAAACGSSGSPQASPSHSPKTSASSPPPAAPTPPQQKSDIPGVTVSGDFGKAPQVKIDTPLSVSEPVYTVLHQGQGDPVVAGKQALINLDLVDGKTGKQAASTFGQPTPYYLQAVSSAQFFPAVVDAITGKPVGTRVAVALPAKDAYGAKGNPQLHIGANEPVVFVVDIVSVQPSNALSGPKGTKASNLPKGLPTVVEKDGNVTGLDFSSAPKSPPSKLEVIPLVKGTGPVAKKNTLVTFDYFGAVWGETKPFDESYTKQPVTFPLGSGQLIKAWDQGLVGLHQGSRVMIVAPPDVAYGANGSPQGGIPKNATLVFVVDILGTSG